jgi:hypothetical protein
VRRIELIRKASEAIQMYDVHKHRRDITFRMLARTQDELRTSHEEVDTALQALRDWDFAYYCRHGVFP